MLFGVLTSRKACFQTKARSIHGAFRLANRRRRPFAFFPVKTTTTLLLGVVVVVLLLPLLTENDSRSKGSTRYLDCHGSRAYQEFQSSHPNGGLVCRRHSRHGFQDWPINNEQVEQVGCRVPQAGYEIIRAEARRCCTLTILPFPRRFRVTYTRRTPDCRSRIIQNWVTVEC